MGETPATNLPGDAGPTGPWQLLELDDQALLGQCAVDCYRASGPGGQKRNKTSSAVRLRHLPTGLAAGAEEERSQHTNKARALRRLRATIALQLRQPIGDLASYKLSPLLARCVNKKAEICVGRRDALYARAVAETLDILAAAGWQVSTAAEVLGVSTAHLVKFLEKDDKLWARVNQLRSDAGLKPLRPRS